VAFGAELQKSAVSVGTFTDVNTGMSYGPHLGSVDARRRL